MPGWLEYGLDPRNNLVHIADAPERGKSSLQCPYCQGNLIADTITRRFAHAGEACPPSMCKEDAPVLPLYHDFTLGLTPRELNALRAVDVRGRASDDGLVLSLARRGFCRWNLYRGRGMGYELTRLGKIPFGQLSLYLFTQVQESLIGNRMETLHKKAKTGDPVAQADLRIFRAQVRRVQASTLYLLEVRVPDSTLHKIGVTTRTIQERMTEVAADLRAFFDDPAVNVLGTWPGRGSVEPYFKFRYRTQNFPIETLTEYFNFEHPASVLRDLRRLHPHAWG